MQKQMYERMVAEAIGYTANWEASEASMEAVREACSASDLTRQQVAEIVSVCGGVYQGWVFVDFLALMCVLSDQDIVADEDGRSVSYTSGVRLIGASVMPPDDQGLNVPESLDFDDSRREVVDDLRILRDCRPDFAEYRAAIRESFDNVENAG